MAFWRKGGRSQHSPAMFLHKDPSPIPTYYGKYGVKSSVIAPSRDRYTGKQLPFFNIFLFFCSLLSWFHCHPGIGRYYKSTQAKPPCYHLQLCRMATNYEAWVKHSRLDRTSDLIFRGSLSRQQASIHTMQKRRRSKEQTPQLLYLTWTWKSDLPQAMWSAIPARSRSMQPKPLSSSLSSSLMGSLGLGEVERRKNRSLDKEGIRSGTLGQESLTMLMKLQFSSSSSTPTESLSASLFLCLFQYLLQSLTRPLKPMNVEWIVILILIEQSGQVVRCFRTF